MNFSYNVRCVSSLPELGLWPFSPSHSFETVAHPMRIKKLDHNILQGYLLVIKKGNLGNHLKIVVL